MTMATAPAWVVQVDTTRCDLCDGCNAVCPTNAIDVDETEWRLIAEDCVLCGFCVTFCPVEALAMQPRAA